MTAVQEASAAFDRYVEEVQRRVRVERDPLASQRLKRRQRERTEQAFATFRIAFDRMARPLSLAAVNGRLVGG